MVRESIVGLVLITNLNLNPLSTDFLLATPSSTVQKAEEKALARRELDLSLAPVFTNNILLALHYKNGDLDRIKASKEQSGNIRIDWEKARKPFEVIFTLKPREMFAFHKNVLPKLRDSIVHTMNSRFYGDEGYEFINGLGGNGVCNLASLINWAATEAGLEVVSEIDHNFAPIPGIPQKYGTSIFYANEGENSQNQNLYIKNTFDSPVTFKFAATENEVVLEIVK